MSKPIHILSYKGWEIFAVTGQPLSCPSTYIIKKYVMTGRGKDRTKALQKERSGFSDITLAKRWIGRHEALSAGRGLRKAKPKVITKGIVIKHTCVKPENKTFTRMRFSKKRDSITYVNRTYSNSKHFAYDAVILNHPDKTQNWFDALPEVWTCETCKFSITKTEIMNTYLVRKMGHK